MKEELDTDHTILFQLYDLEHDLTNSRNRGDLIRNIRKNFVDEAAPLTACQQTIQKLVGIGLGTDNEKTFLFARSALLAHIKDPKNGLGCFASIGKEVDFMRGLLAAPSKKTDTIERMTENLAMIGFSQRALDIKFAIDSWRRHISKRALAV